MFRIGIKIKECRNRQQQFLEYFTLSEDHNSVYCTNIEGLMSALHLPVHNPINWRLFIDSSKTSLKAVLLHFDNRLSPVPVFYGINTKETYETMKFVLDNIEYNAYQ